MHVDETLRAGSETFRKALVLLLSCAAGAVDAVSFRGLGNVFAANMTGNTVHLAMALGQLQTRDFNGAAAALLGFLAGALAGAGVVERDDTADAWPPLVTLALWGELVLLVGTGVAWIAGAGAAPALVYVLLGGLGAAMGVQSAAVRRLRISGVVSTYLTGTLTTLMASIVRRAERGPRPTPEAPAHGIGLMAAVWTIYFAGALIATLLPVHDARALVLPVVLVTIVVLARTIQPSRARG